MGLNICLMDINGKDHPKWDDLNPRGRKDDCVYDLIEMQGWASLLRTTPDEELFKFTNIEKVKKDIESMDIDDKQKRRLNYLIDLQEESEDYWIWLSH